jgi:hypothetical protein
VLALASLLAAALLATLSWLLLATLSWLLLANLSGLLLLLTGLLAATLLTTATTLSALAALIGICHPPPKAGEPVEVVDKLPKTPPSEIVFLRYDPDDSSGGNYWRWNGKLWEPAVPGTTVPSNRRE